MKRPRLLFFIAAWCFLGLFLQVSGFNRHLRAPYRTTGERVPPQIAILVIVGLGFIFWQTIGLLHLKRFNRWFATTFLSLWTLVIAWNCIFVLGHFLVTLFFVTLLNLLSAAYLSRPTFREFAVGFVAERDRQKSSAIVTKTPV